jgi:hypothetical protein
LNPANSFAEALRFLACKAGIILVEDASNLKGYGCDHESH